MDAPDLPEIVHWPDLSPEQQQDRLARAAVEWGRLEDAPPWDSLPESKQIIAARTVHLIDPEAGQRTYACPKCFRKGLPPEHAGVEPTPVVYQGPELGAPVWFCDCRAGVVMESGYWFRRMFEKRGRKVVVDDRVKTEFNAYLSVRETGHALRIRDAVNALASQAEMAPVEEGR